LTRRDFLARSATLGIGLATAGLPIRARAAQKPEKLIFLGTSSGWVNAFRGETVPEWEGQTGIKVEMSFLPVDPLKAKLRTEFTGGTAPYDVIMWTAEWRGWIHPFLEDHEQLLQEPATHDPHFDFEDFASAAREMARYRGKQLGFPYRATAMMLHYQKAVLREAGITRPPETFAELLEAATKTTTAGQPGKADRYGLGVFGKQGGAIVNGWIPYLYSAGGRLYDEEKYDIYVNSLTAVESLQFYGDLVAKHHVVPPESLTWEWDEIIAGGQNNRYAMAIMHAPYGSNLQDPKSSKTTGAWAWSQMPGSKAKSEGRSWILGWILSVPQKAPNKEWASRFVQFAASKAEMKKSIFTGNLPPRVSVLNDSKVLSAYPWASEGATALARAWQVPGDEMWDALENRLRPAISEVLLGQKPAKRALDEVADDWRKLLRRAGKIK
jgi:ABC-type glycerol-3-phosphate transport system substrate-binding protein